MNPAFNFGAQPQGGSPFGQVAPMPQQQNGGGMWGGSSGGGGMTAGAGMPITPAQAPAGAMPMSFDIATFVEGGGLLDNVTVRFENVRTCMFDYKGKQAPSPAVQATLVVLDLATGQPVPGQANEPQFWTCGSANEYTVSADGRFILPLTDKKGLNKGSNWAVFIESAHSAGFPKQALATGDASVFNGLVAHVQRRVVKREGLEKKDGQRENGILCVKEIRALPGGGQAQQPQPAQQMQQAPQMQMQPQYGQPVPPAPQQQFTQPQSSPTPMAAPFGHAPAAPATNADPALAAAAQVLQSVMSTAPATMQDFNIRLFQATMTNQGLRQYVMDPNIQTQVLGAPVRLP